MGERPRIPGYDLARFLAVFGFVVVDMVGQVVWSDEGGGFGQQPEGPVALYWSWQLWWGRASAMLAVLAGTGLALLFREGLGDDELGRKRRVILRRCLFLFVVGHLWNSSTLWSWSILHYYTFFLAIGLLFVRAKPKALALAAALFATVGVVDGLAFREVPDWMTEGFEEELGEEELAALRGDGERGDGPQDSVGTDEPVDDAPDDDLGPADAAAADTSADRAEDVKPSDVEGASDDAAAGGAEGASDDAAAGKAEGDAWDDEDWEGDFGDPKIWQAEFWSVRHHLVGTLFDGMYPVFPWMAFLLVGMAVVRLGLDTARTRRRVLAGAVLATGAAYAAWWAARALDWSATAQLVTDVDRFACMPGYLVTAAGQAVILLCLALEVAERWPTARWLPALVATGQMTFSVYIFRIFIGGGDRAGLYDWLGFADGTTRSVLTDGWLRVAIFLPLTILVCHLWVRRFGRGPLEAAMRRFSDR